MRHRFVVRSCVMSLVVAVAIASAPVPAFAAGPGLRTLRVSGTALTPSNSASYWGSASSGARYVAFQSYATNLAGGGSGADIFVRDMRTSQVRCVSGAPAGVPNGASSSPSISSSGQVVAFASNSTNLVAGDTNSSWDVFCRSLSATAATAASVSSEGVLGNGDSSSPSLSANGRYVAFVSAASNLADGDSGTYDDIYVRDLVAGVTKRVSVGVGGVEANGHSSAPSINAGGTKVAFASRASNLVPGDTNGCTDVFVVDVATLVVTRASVGGTNTQANLGSYAPSISGSGSRVAFESLATNLVAKDTNDVRDVFVRDLVARSTSRASVSSKGRQGSAESREPSLSSAGTRVAFSSSAPNLVSGDTNGRADIFVRSLSAKSTIRVSRPPTGQVKGSCGGAALSPEGSRVVYQSAASNIVGHDSNRRSDVFVASWGSRVYDRVQGISTYATAAQASKRAAPFGAGAVVITNGSDWRAALAASGLAGAVRGPLLYTSAGTLPAATREEIVRLGAKRVYVVGGTSLVSSAVASDLASIVGTTGVERVGSGGGYAVANSVSSRVSSLKGKSWNGAVIVVSGASHKASIAAVPLAASSGRPMVLVNPKTRAYRLPAGTKSAIIVGSSASVPSSVERSLKRRLGTKRVARLVGRNSYETATAIATKSVRMRHVWDGVAVVNVSRPAEAICGAVMAGRMGTVVLYTTRSKLPSATRSRLGSARLRIDRVHVIGTTSSASSSVVSAIRKALGG